MVFSRRHPEATRRLARFEEGLTLIGKNGHLQAIQDGWWQRLVGSKPDSPAR